MTEVSFAPQRVAKSLALAGLLVLLVGFPADLFNSTLEENYDEVRNWFRWRHRLAGWLSRWRRRFTPTRRRQLTALRFAVFALVAASLYSLLDSRFVEGGKAAFAVVLGFFVAIVFTTLALELPVARYLRRTCSQRPVFRVFPGALAVAVACVTLSRVAKFEPGYAYGVFAGYALTEGSHISTRQQGHSVLIGSLYVMAVSGVAWLAWTPVHNLVSNRSPLPLLALDDVLCLTFVLGVEGLVFSLIPVRFLPGEQLAKWSRTAWLALHLLATFAFVHILLDKETSRVDTSTTASRLSMLALFIAFRIISLAFWGYFRYRSPRSTLVIDCFGQEIGRLEEVRLDNGGRQIQWISVRTGIAKRRIVFVPPPDQPIDETGGVIRVSFPRAKVRGAPPVESSGRMSDEEQATLSDYYGLRSPGRSASSTEARGSLSQARPAEP